jgi:hypothetical protein
LLDDFEAASAALTAKFAPEPVKLDRKPCTVTVSAVIRCSVLFIALLVAPIKIAHTENLQENTR